MPQTAGPQTPETPTTEPLTLVPAADAGPDVPSVVPEPRRPNLKGDLDSVLEFLPVFRGAVRGYERSQVDSYVTWAERELRAARRSADEMAARFAAVSAELDRARQELSRSAGSREARLFSERVAHILELAADEAAEIRAAGAAEADGLVTAARTWSAAMMQHAREAEDAAAAERDRATATRAEAADELAAAGAEAADELAAARAEAGELRAAAVREQQRLAAEAARERRQLEEEAAARRAAAEEKARRQQEQEMAAAAEVVAAARREIEQLHAQWDRATESLQLLTGRISEALATLAASMPAEPPNVVAPQPRDRTPAG
jgi:colicin import membrane protein